MRIVVAACALSFFLISSTYAQTFSHSSCEEAAAQAPSMSMPLSEWFSSIKQRPGGYIVDTCYESMIRCGKVFVSCLYWFNGSTELHCVNLNPSADHSPHSLPNSSSAAQVCQSFNLDAPERASTFYMWCPSYK